MLSRLHYGERFWERKMLGFDVTMLLVKLELLTKQEFVLLGGIIYIYIEESGKVQYT